MSNFFLMKRFVLGSALASLVAVCTGACDDSSAGYDGSGGYGGGNCSSYTTCESCTPVSGCGWCFNATGGGCASDPDQCANVSEFTWTWDLAGCPNVDASVVPPGKDGGSGSPESGAPESSAADTGVSESSAPETGATEAGSGDSSAD